MKIHKGHFSENRLSAPANSGMNAQKTGICFGPVTTLLNYLNVHLKTILTIFNNPLRTGVSVNNVLNKVFKNYMNRFRYFIREMR